MDSVDINGQHLSDSPGSLALPNTLKSEVRDISHSTTYHFRMHQQHLGAVGQPNPAEIQRDCQDARPDEGVREGLPGVTEKDVVRFLTENPEITNKAAEVLRNIALGLQKFIEEHGDAIAQITQNILDLGTRIAPYLAALPELEHRLNEQTTVVFQKLPNSGWYFDPAMTTTHFFQIAELIHAGKTTALDSLFIGHLKGRSKEIEEELLSDNPGRKPILDAAFRAHRDGNYALSIPTFLAQIDGISCEFIKTEFFGRNGIKEVKRLLATRSDGVSADITLQSLSVYGSVKMPSNQSNSGDFNRHAIMHGSDSKYATETNAWKTISLLNLVNRINRAKKEEESPAGGTA